MRPDLAYRADINGLRAVAIVCVLAYHFNTGLLPGGFIGVDVFFVISGYLITGIIAAPIAERQFSLSGFYAGRVRRLVPALTVMLVITQMAAALLLYPVEWQKLADSILATIVLLTNVYFSHRQGYFGNEAALQPLLHVWSLAVEAQFYLVFPLLLMGIRWVGGSQCRWLAILALASFGWSTLVSVISPATAYFDPFSRAWEFLLGGWLALVPLPQMSHRIAREGLAVGGLLLILAAVWMFQPMMSFASLYALAPVGGAGLLLAAGQAGSTVTGRWLSLTPVTVIGLLSYSIYLWHWPLAVFWHLAWDRPLLPRDSALLIPAALGLSYATWRWVEAPMRHASAFAGRQRWTRVTGGWLVLAASGLIVLGAHGVTGRFSAEAERLAGYLAYDDTSAYRRGRCFLDGNRQGWADFDTIDCLRRRGGRAGYLLIGDSHGAHWWAGLSQALPDVDVLQATASGCKPLISSAGTRRCRAFIDRVYAGLPDFRPDAVILSARWRDSDLPDLLRSLERLEQLRIRAVVLGPIAEYTMPLARLLADERRYGRRDFPQHRRAGRIAATDRVLADGLRAANVRYISVYDALCPPPQHRCMTLTTDGVPMQWDYGHLTEAGARTLAARIAPRLKP